MSSLIISIKNGALHTIDKSTVHALTVQTNQEIRSLQMLP